MPIRSYLFPEGADPLRLSQRLIERLINGEDALPEFAGTRQKELTVYLDMEGRDPIKIRRAEGSIWIFDDEGKIHEGLLMAGNQALSSAADLAFSQEQRTVVDISNRLKRKKFWEEFRWEPGEAELDRVAADLWPKSVEDRLKQAKGISKPRPPLTREAAIALDEASREFWNTNLQIERLTTEPGLKGFEYEARKRSKEDPDFGHLYRALADMAKEKLDIVKRRKSSRGKWYAVVDVQYWRDNVGETVECFHECCSGKTAAILAARRLLSEHADKFSEETTVEARVVTDLEWKKESF